MNIAQLPLDQRLSHISTLRYFLATAPITSSSTSPIHNSLALPTGDTITCVCWHSIFHITTTDILRALYSRFACFGRPVTFQKRFEEGVIADLRQLRVERDAVLEETRSPLLEFLHQHQCIRTLKRQRVYYWYSVPHDRLFLDALERDIRRERRGLLPTSVAVAEPALHVSGDATDEALFELRRSLLGDESSSTEEFFIGQLGGLMNSSSS
ncbi:uncharacterized protein VTP21DRAFT_3546 [Calcarisporiella thermophila]|uniref:uncharacterized protein n=1 Tax=Calcarisporiella thermophila TaxID=911321 RepID=UPI003743728C